jgi:hypothetical protein
MKIIFAHNSHNRPKTLRRTVEIEKAYFPESDCYLAITENGGISEDSLLDLPNTKIIKTFGNTWQLGCVNCFYCLISKIVEEHEDAIVIFSHDDLYLKNYDVVEKVIKKMLNDDISFIVRRPKRRWGEQYFMMETVYMRLSHVKNNFIPFSSSLYPNEYYIVRDNANHISAEAWLYSKLYNINNGVVIEYEHVDSTLELVNAQQVSSLGYEHLNFGKHAWKE